MMPNSRATGASMSALYSNSTTSFRASRCWRTSHWSTKLPTKPLDPREALALVGLDQRLDHFPSQLSGGEQQRVAVARAIVKSPDVLLCDEPTGALDYDTGKVVLAAIVRANERLGTTTIIITHNAAIAGMADRVLRLGGGRIVGEERNARRLSPEEVRW